MQMLVHDNLELVKKFASEWLGKVGYESSFRYFNAPLPNRLERLKNHLTTVVTVDFDGEPMAYGHLDQGEDGRVWLGVAVMPDYQRKQYGTVICNYLLEQAFLKNLNEIWLGVDEDNIPARRLYRKLGFEIAAMEKDFWLMKKVFDKQKSSE
jgi:ribosomal protein S18 acetylase RimI-like enzyme